MPDDRLSRVEMKLEECTDLALNRTASKELRDKSREAASQWANIAVASIALALRAKQEG